MTGLPYVIHPYGVAIRLLAIGADDATIIAGLFHDAIEDKTPMTLARLAQDYGDEVAQLVSSVTDRWPASSGLPREERKRLYRAQVAQSGQRAHTLKLADILDNIVGIVALDKRFAKVYLPEALAMVEVLTLGHPGLRQEVMGAVERERGLLQDLLH